MRRNCFLILLLLCALSTYGQEYLGLRTGNYAGIHGIALNPAVNVNGPKQFDINFFSAGFFFDNNYIFLERANLPIAFLKAPRLRPNPAIEMDRAPIENPLYYNYFDRQSQRYNFYSNAFIMGPSAMVNYGNHSFGIYTANKMHGYAHRIATDYGYYYYQDSLTTEMFLDPMKQGLLHYGEIGINYGTRIAKLGLADLNIGVTAKYIMPWDAIFLRNNLTREAIKIDDGIKIPEGADVDFNWASNYRYDYVNDRPIYNLQRNGNGIAFDLGFTLTNRMGTDPDRASNWRVGFAVLDVGRIWINRNAESNRFITTDTVIYRSQFFENARDLDSFRAIANFHAFGTYDATVTGSSFAVMAPLSFSAFADVNVGGGSFYVSTNVIVRAPMRAIGLERANLIAVTPRIEKEHFEISIPVSLYNFTSPRAGLFIRRRFFFMGIDNFTSWLIPQRLTGTDFYFGFRWSGNMAYKTDNRNLSNRGKFLRCPVF